MSLPYCPNCRVDLPERIESWTCLECKPLDELHQSETTDLGGGDFGGSGGTDDIPYQSERPICETFNHSGEECIGCKQARKKGLFELACPSCRMELPVISNCDPRTITVTGPSGSGKSHYIVALDYWWAQQLNRFRLVAVPAMGERIKRAFKSFSSQVVRQRRRLPATLAGKMISFSWQVKPTDGSRPGLLFTLPDVAGERLLSARALLANRYYHHTSGVIFLVDSDRMILTDNPDSVIGGTARDPADHFEVANAMITDMERRSQDAPEKVRNTPIAICVNKIDKLRIHDQRWDEIARDFTPVHDGCFDINCCSERSDRIRDLLYSDPDLAQALGLLEATFNHVMYFIIATIGSDTESIRLMPVAVEDPFLFHLWHLDYIPTNYVTV